MGCSKYRELVSDEIMQALAPNGLSMGDKHVLQTGNRSADYLGTAVRFETMTSLFYVCCLAEQSASNSGIPGVGMIDTKFVVGHLDVDSRDYRKAALFSTQNGPSPHPLQRPVELHGVKKIMGKEVFESIAQGAIIFNNAVPSSNLALLRAEFEDGLMKMASTKPEDCIQSRNTFVLNVPLRDAIALVWSLTDEIYRRDVHYDRNTLTVTFDAGFEPSEDAPLEQHEEWVRKCWETTVPLWGRNAQRTIMPGLGGNQLDVGQLRMQFVLLPRELVVVKVAYSQLLSPGGTMINWSNRTSSNSRTEFNRLFKDTKHCKHCLRSVSRTPFMHGCTCD